MFVGKTWFLPLWIRATWLTEALVCAQYMDKSPKRQTYQKKQDKDFERRYDWEELAKTSLASVEKFLPRWLLPGRSPPWPPMGFHTQYPLQDVQFSSLLITLVLLISLKKYYLPLVLWFACKEAEAAHFFSPSTINFNLLAYAEEMIAFSS